MRCIGLYITESIHGVIHTKTLENVTIWLSSFTEAYVMAWNKQTKLQYFFFIFSIKILKKEINKIVCLTQRANELVHAYSSNLAYFDFQISNEPSELSYVYTDVRWSL